ncbi:ion channel [Altericroceibacterium endophyticum]|uniref:Two pore domain potassium channel family protein n=1 Tax=Altericroceibacterium endophyticum TaxID=1808508 RepID=A0A6I4TAB9_9SPHN|nr:two pore domain potassium channel family protein [Altericroceibacterium endophyticum]
MDSAVNNQVLEATFNAQLLIGAGMIALCVVIHGMGLFTLQRLLQRDSVLNRIDKAQPLSFHGATFTVATVFALILVHFVQIWCFAFLYDYLHAVSSFEDALYFSTISYATIGFSDAQIAEQWRLLAAQEGIVGVILMGWSTAFFVRILGRLEGR